MDVEKKMVKDDINFLEYPNWVVSRRGQNKLWKIEKPHGTYEIVSPHGLPQHFDKIVAYFLLYKLHREKNSNTCTVTTSRYEIGKNVLGVKNFGKNAYDRIMLSLKRWKAISINFEGVFFEGDGYTIRYFAVIDEVVLQKESGELTVRFNEMYLKQLNETKFYKYIDFEQYKKLRKSSSARLYEILIKNFKERSEWAINIQGLAEKMTFEKRDGAKDYYSSDVLRHLKPAVNEINKKTDLSIDFQYNKDSGTCIFKKLTKRKITFIAATKEESPDKKTKKVNTAKQINACVAYFKTLSSDEQGAIQEEIKKQPFLKFLPDENFKIYAYMIKSNKWSAHESKK